mmetsp:Transcript_31383/g.29924  ORF Transcript_31383/g.29924 Transcript_31383/m.29924 type:complete len:127 (-) Transcript_31383:310-690(-)
MEKYSGGCHCGSIRFIVKADLEDITYCNCSICAMKGLLHLIISPDKFQLIQGEGNLSTYEFNTKVAKHKFCKICGIQSFYIPRSDPDKIDVNARCLDIFPTLDITPKQFDGQNWEKSMEKDIPWRH